MVREHSQGIERYEKRAFLLQGALAGMLGTLPMTIVMLILHRLLPNWQKYALPPEEITDDLAKRSDLRRRINKEQLLAATLKFVTHPGYQLGQGAVSPNGYANAHDAESSGGGKRPCMRPCLCVLSAASLSASAAIRASRVSAP